MDPITAAATQAATQAAVDKGLDIVGNAEIANKDIDNSYTKGNNLQAEGNVNITDSHRSMNIVDKSKNTNAISSARYGGAIAGMQGASANTPVLETNMPQAGV